MNPLESHFISGSNYGFSGTRLGDLDASEYTLVSIAADCSGSVHAFRDRMEACLAEVVRACRRAPRAHNLMLRLGRFDDKVQEVHGYKPLAACDPAAMTGALEPGGMTALFDATHNAVASLVGYARGLHQAGLAVNGLVVVLTDGADNASLMPVDAARQAIGEALGSEAVESVLTVLVGVNVRDPSTSAALQSFRTDAGFDAYIELDDASADTLGALAGFVTRSIAAQSVALGSGAASRLLTF